MTSVAVVFPCLNEELAVGGCVKEALEVFKEASIDGTVIVVDNNSSDRSAEIAAEAGAVVIQQLYPGYGAALRSGFEWSDADILVMADADGTYELSAIPRLVQPIIDDQADLVLGARLKSASGETMPFLHRFVGTPAISWMVNRAAGGLNVNDSQSGFRAFDRKKVMALGLNGTGMELASEMLVRAGWAKLRISEVDTTYSERIGISKLQTFSDGLRHLRQLLVLSPDVFAVYPGLAMSAVAVLMWTLAAFVSDKAGDVGSAGWICLLIGGVMSVIGPLTFAAGMLVRYRARALGIRHEETGISMETLLRRLSITGFVLLGGVVTILTMLVVNYHHGSQFLDRNAETVLGSMARSLLTVGIILAGSPLLQPLITARPMRALPPAERYIP